MRKRRVVVTGLGVVSANGIGIKDFWEEIKAGKSAISQISSFAVSDYPIKIAGEVKNFTPEKFLDEKIIRQTTRFAQFALVAAKEAMKHSKLIPKDYDPEKTGILIGTSMGGLDFAFKEHEAFLKKGFFAMDSFVMSITNPSSASRIISMEFQTKGSAQTFCSTCVASADAIGYGVNLIKRGELDIVIAGGAESPICPPIISGFYLGRILTGEPNTPRPFDLSRNGTVLSEGAAILILEELDHALERGADIYAEIAGYASTNDAYHVVSPDPEGRQGVRAVALALKNARTKREKVDYINTHGTATIKNDQVETLIIKKVFGKRAYKIPISSTKSMTGHLLGASGAIEALICVLAIKNSFIPPTTNYKNFDLQCDLDCVPNEGRKANLKVVISNSFGFGGLNSVLVFKKIKM